MSAQPVVPVTKREVQSRIRGLDADTQKRMVCALVGHSRIQSFCFGYFNCGRCGEQVGDSLGGVYPEAAQAVVIGHNCEACQKNAETLTWRDTLLAPDPFATEPSA
jgi:hypothetical protein